MANAMLGEVWHSTLLKCLSRNRCHHRLKTFHAGWHDEQLPDGTVLWTSPTGQTYRTSPGGTDLFPDMGPPACQAPKPVRRNRPRERAARIARIRNRNRAQRPLNEAHRRLQSARSREISHRRDRNRMRKTLFIPQRPAQHEPLLHLDQRPARTRRAAARLAATTGTTAGSERSAVLINIRRRRTRSSP